MQRFWIAAALGLAVSAGAAQADFGGPLMPPAPPNYPGGPMAGESPNGPRDRYGLHPLLRRVAWWSHDFGGCQNCGPQSQPAMPPVGMASPMPMPPGGGHPMPMPMPPGGGQPMPGGYGMGGYGPGVPGAPGAGMPGTPGAQMPGTLVFPHHWYIRSPRDYFMSDARPR